MPSLVTHFYLADRVVDKYDNSKLVKIIKKYKQAYTIGAQGPDLWLYHCGAPYSDSKKKIISNEYSKLVHTTKTNDFFKSCLNSIKKCDDQDLKEAMISYTLGHLSHWVMDSTCHPYVIYFSGNGEKGTEHWHVRLEEMIDNFIIKIMKNEERTTYTSVKNIVKYDDMCDKAIQKIYLPALKDVYDIEVEAKEVKQALKDFYNIVSFMNDKIGVVYCLMRLYELKLNDKWDLTSHFITEKLDKERDILNLKKKTWYHPCDNTEIHNESFLELIDECEKKTIELFNLFSISLETNDDSKLFEFLDDVNYEIGRKGTYDIKYYEVIY